MNAFDFSKGWRAAAASLTLAATAALAPAAALAEDTLTRIKDAGVLRVGMADSIPAQQKNPITGTWEGFNVDMAQRIAEVLEVELEIVDQTWATLVPGLMQAQYDIAMVDMFRTPARAITVDFTDSYMVTGNTWLVADSVTATDWIALNAPEYTIANIAGMAAVAQSQRLLPDASHKTIVSDNAVAGQLEVAAGRAHAHLSDHVQNALFIKANPDAKVKILGGDAPIEATGYSWGVKPGDAHFLNFLNTFIAHGQTTGLIAERKAHWYGIQ